MDEGYFFDTYAFFEIIKQNPNYSEYLKVGIITTRLNLMELHYHLLREVGKYEADRHFNRFLPFCISFSNEDIKKANELKLEYKKRKLSYIDCLGYVIAIKRNVKFLTGDNQFKDLKDVEFVK